MKYYWDNLEKFKKERVRRREYFKKKNKQYRTRHKKYFKEYMYAYVRKNRNHFYYEEIRKRYGLKIDDFYSMLKKQNYKCLICGNGNKKRNRNFPHVDHNHKTGKVRGLLCRNCNFGIGNFKDNKKIIIKALKYLKKYD